MDGNVHQEEMANAKLEDPVPTPGTGAAHSSRPRWPSPALFGVILLCFLLPFITVTCEKPVTVTGVQAATGMGLDSQTRPYFADHQEPVPNPLAAIALVSAIAGLAFSFAKGRWALGGSAAVGATGALALATLVLYAKNQTRGDVVLGPGLLAAPLFLIAAVLNAVRVGLSPWKIALIAVGITILAAFIYFLWIASGLSSLNGICNPACL